MIRSNHLKIGLAALFLFALSACSPVANNQPAPSDSMDKEMVETTPSVPTAPATAESTEVDAPETKPAISATPEEKGASTAKLQPVETAEPTMDRPAPETAAKPEIVDTYPLVPLHMAMEGAVTASPGKIWVGCQFGMIDVFNQKDGALAQTIPLFPGSGGLMPQPVMELAFDGQHVWAIASSDPELIPNHLFVLNPADGKIIKQWETSSWLYSEFMDQYAGPDGAKFGFSEGKVWVMGKIIDEKTFEMTDFDSPLIDLWLADGGSGWMWVGGAYAMAHQNLIAVNIESPETVRIANYDPNIDIGLTDIFVAAGDKLWVASASNLTAISADGGEYGDGFKPLATVPMKEDWPIEMLYDGHYIWLLKSENNNLLYQIDPVSGKTILEIDVTGAPETGTKPPDLPQDIAFDGHDLWLLSINSISRIDLPYLD